MNCRLIIDGTLEPGLPWLGEGLPELGDRLTYARKEVLVTYVEGTDTVYARTVEPVA